MNNQSNRDPVSDQTAQPSLPARPDEQTRDERPLGEVGATQSAAKQGENVEHTRELIRIEKGQLRINAFLAVITLVAVLVAIFSAVKSINLTRETGHLDQRAWLSTAGFYGEPEKPEVGKLWEIVTRYQNTGKTFAKEVSGNTLCIAMDRGKEPDFDSLLAKEGQGEGSIMLMAPNSEYAASTNAKSSKLEITQADLDHLNSGDVQLFIFGRMDYRDIFGCSHWIKFCVTYDPKSGSFLYYRKHNATDNNACP